MKTDTTLGNLIRHGLTKKKFTQAKVVDSFIKAGLKITKPALSEIVSGKRASTDAEIVLLARLLDLPLDKMLVAASIDRCNSRAENNEKDNQQKKAQYWREAASQYDKIYKYNIENINMEVHEKGTRNTLKHKSEYITLADFPNITDGKWVVITGDRRDQDRPKSLGDIATYNVSVTDLMFLPKLHLSEDTRIVSDKVIRICSGPKEEKSGNERLRKLFGNANLLLFGSGVVSLATREILSTGAATMMFNIKRDLYERERNLYDSLLPEELFDEEALIRFKGQAHIKSEIKTILPHFMRPGFVDPINFKGVRGIARPHYRDYGIVAIAENPWSSKHIAVICAGIGGGGTAAATKLLCNPAEFTHRPWGGVLYCNLPNHANYEERFNYLNPKFDTEEYTPDKYIKDLNALKEALRINSSNMQGLNDVDLRHDKEIEQMLKLAKRLKNNLSP